FDLGAGVIYPFIAKTSDDRRRVLRAIGPVWDGNEVWLLAAGGTLYFAFPQLYASGFSGFYLPLMMVLWLLMLRGIGIEFRTHMAHGALYVAIKTEGELSARARSVAVVAWPVQFFLTCVSLVATYFACHRMFDNYGRHPVGLVVPVLVFGSLAVMVLATPKGK